MFSFFNFFSQKKYGYNANEIVDALENNVSIQIQSLHFAKDYSTRHHNTYLLQAIAWNRKNAALKLIELDKNKVSLNLKDDWPTCKNSPIILAAKINSVDIIKKLILAGVNVNEQDYRGFTALHYACLLRNEDAIKQLLAANVNLQLTDVFGKKPYDYYCMEITEKDLQYRYGQKGKILSPVPDTDNHYFATRNKCLSAIRWYIAHIIVNNNLGKSDFIESTSLYDYAKKCLLIREPVYDASFYVAMMKCFLDNRPKINLSSLDVLVPKLKSPKPTIALDDIRCSKTAMSI